ncbi:MAG: hypothetical protein M1821_000459 [Bathelium mastoideum]|nr:MAG: hypothetical protein M1821_000459 [Bathelium mastoideum]
MVQFLWSLSFLALISPISSLKAPAHHVVHERRDVSSKKWVKRGRPESTAVLPMRIGLAQNSLDDAHGHLMDVSDPTSPNYGKHWTSEQVNDVFQPSNDTIQAVTQWLEESGISSSRIRQSANKVWLNFGATVREAERLLYTDYHIFEHRMKGDMAVACDQYHLPKHVREHVDFITPGIHVGHLRMYPDDNVSSRKELKKRKDQKFRKRLTGYPIKVSKKHSPAAPMAHNSSDLSTCDVAITPACLAALYKIPEPAPRNVTSNNSLGIYESELQFWEQEDLNLFFTNFTRRIPNGTHPIDVGIDGGVATTPNVSLAGGEAELDLMMAYPIIYPQTITVFNEDDLFYQAFPNQTYTFGFDDLLDAFDGSYCSYSAYGQTGNSPIDPVYPDNHPGGYQGNLQCGGDTPPNVLSVSYGGQEADVPVAYQKRQCNEFLKLGLQGVSFLFASGDSGVGNYPTPYGDDGPTGCLGPNLDVFNPTWPNNCPYVTNVGATKVYPGKTVFEPESAVYDPAGHPYSVNYSSGGGFSNVYPIPDYQQSAVFHYFQNYDPPYPYYSALANETGDIHNILTKPNITELQGGTNGIYNRIGRGIPDVAANGDNGAVYVGGNFSLSGGTSQATPIFASIINRIVEERIRKGKGALGFLNPALYNNPSMFNDITNGSNPACNTLGFSTAPGWDPVTGLGTANYPKMLEYFLSLP